jgi:mRNA-degrading endonuclease toxin of MazEF toxin-antitoxin module
MGRHSVVVATRDPAPPLLGSVVCALVTSGFHGHAAEIELDPEEGLDHRSAANCDNLFPLPLRVLVQRWGRLGSAKLQELGGALMVALGRG